MAMGIVKLYISLVSEFFALSDVANNTPPLHLPQNSHSLSTAYYLLKILADIQEIVSELRGMEISEDNGLKSFLDSVRCRFIDVLANSWLQGTSLLYTIIVASIIRILRCSNLLFDGGLVTKPRRTLHYPSPCPNGEFPERAHNRSI
jgi:hypothetical protein